MWQKFLFFLMLVIIISSPAQSQTGQNNTVQSQTEKNVVLKKVGESIKGGNYAIIIGINDYDSDSIMDLKYCENDAKRFAEVLKAQGWDNNKIRLLIGPSAKYEKIYETVNSISGMQFVPTEATIIFFFSGHGMMVEGSHYLVPWDGTVNPNLVKNKNIQLSMIEDAIRNSKFDRKLLFIDACRSEFAKGYKEAGFQGFGRISSPKGMRIVLSAEEGQVSIEDDTLKSGVFTYFVIDGFSNKADKDNDGIVTLYELEGYVAKRMEEYTFKTGKIQRLVSDGECNPLVPLALVGLPTIKTRWLSSIPIEIAGKRAGFKYQLSPPVIEIQVEGEELLVDSLIPSKVKAVFDVSEYSDGTYSILPLTQLGYSSIPPNVRIISVKQPNLEILITGPPRIPSQQIPAKPPVQQNQEILPGADNTFVLPNVEPPEWYVGQSATYALEIDETPNNLTATIRMALVGRETVEGQEFYWFEIDGSNIKFIPVESGPPFKVLKLKILTTKIAIAKYRNDPKTMLADMASGKVIRKIIFQADDFPPQIIDFMTIQSMYQATTGQDLQVMVNNLTKEQAGAPKADVQTNSGKETVTVPAGTFADSPWVWFKSNVYIRTSAETAAGTIHAHSEVPLCAFVKLAMNISGTSAKATGSLKIEMDLIDFKMSGAISLIQGEPEPFDMMKFVDSISGTSK